MSDIQTSDVRPDETVFDEVLIRTDVLSWGTISQTLELDTMSKRIDPELRAEIRKTLDNLTVKNELEMMVIKTDESSWDLIVETLELDSRSTAFDPVLRQQIKSALRNTERISQWD